MVSGFRQYCSWPLPSILLDSHDLDFPFPRWGLHVLPLHSCFHCITLLVSLVLTLPPALPALAKPKGVGWTPPILQRHWHVSAMSSDLSLPEEQGVFSWKSSYGANTAPVKCSSLILYWILQWYRWWNPQHSAGTTAQGLVVTWVH